MKNEKIKMMKKMGAFFSAVLLMLAQSGWAASKGESGGQFLRIGVGARGPGMGGAISPIVDDATAIYWNPAGLSMLNTREVQVSYNAYFEDTAAQFIGYGHPTESHGNFGGAVSLFGVKDIEKRSATAGDADTPDLGTFNTQDFAVHFGYGNKLDMRGTLHYGAVLKFISSDLDTESAATGAVDLGVIHEMGGEGGFQMSLAVLNLGGELKFDQKGDPLPLNIKPGLAWIKELSDERRLSLALDADLLVNDGLAFVQPGFEWWVHRVFALRGGYQIGRDEDAGSGLGAGVGFRFAGLGVDYAFVPFGDLGDTHRVSLGYKF